MASAPFPSSLAAFLRRFSSEEACFAYLVEARWPGGFRCPACGGSRAFRRGGRLALQCSGCEHVCSATAGTVMHGTRQPLASWLLAAYLLVSSKRGISAEELRRHLGLARYEPAFQMLHKLRAAMVAPERELLHGLVEVDETLIGGVQRGVGKGTWKGAQAIVIGGVEIRRGAAPGRVRLWHMPEGRVVLARRFLRENLEPGATIRTDGGYLYEQLAEAGFKHEVVSAARGVAREDVLPTLHLTFSNLKAWLQGTFHGAVRRKHLQSYLDEFTFRFNRRRDLHGAIHRVLGLATAMAGPTYADVYAGTGPRPKAQATH